MLPPLMAFSIQGVGLALSARAHRGHPQDERKQHQQQDFVSHCQFSPGQRG
jgi:hypothetical protein